MAHIFINQSLGAARVSRIFFNPAIFAEVIAILEPARSTRMDVNFLFNEKRVAQVRFEPCSGGI